MTTHCPPILNAIINKKESYLELGIDNRINFNSINSEKKYSVDINQRSSPDFCGTTDKFFEQNKERFDYIFIDANHDYDYVVRDFMNSILVANKCVLMHDMNPPNEFYTQSGHCSDSYKFLTLLKKETNIDVFTLNNDFGLTFVPVTDKVKNLIINKNLITKYKDFAYSDFVEYRDKNINLLSPEEMINKVKEVINSF